MIIVFWYCLHYREYKNIIQCVKFEECDRRLGVARINIMGGWRNVVGEVHHHPVLPYAVRTTFPTADFLCIPPRGESRKRSVFFVEHALGLYTVSLSRHSSRLVAFFVAAFVVHQVGQRWRRGQTGRFFEYLVGWRRCCRHAWSQ